MELYKKYFFIIFIFSFLKSIEIDKNQIIDLSNLDFSTIENSEYQISYGLHSNFFSYDFLNFSIDKLISENLFLYSGIILRILKFPVQTQAEFLFMLVN